MLLAVAAARAHAASLLGAPLPNGPEGHTPALSVALTDARWDGDVPWESLGVLAAGGAVTPAPEEADGREARHDSDDDEPAPGAGAAAWAA